MNIEPLLENVPQPVGVAVAMRPAPVAGPRYTT